MDAVKEFWFAIIAIVSLTAWLVRLEAGMLRNRRDIQRLEEQRREDVASSEKHRLKIDDKLTEIHSDLRNLAVLMQNKADR